ADAACFPDLFSTPDFLIKLYQITIAGALHFILLSKENCMNDTVLPAGLRRRDNHYQKKTV
ncbi:MAG: hypothetical protein Q4D81_02970, partial [Eubacteriales bacterium]|nr:hypothetical protein [Eubacteriales bacterium]